MQRELKQRCTPTGTWFSERPCLTQNSAPDDLGITYRRRKQRASTLDFASCPYDLTWDSGARAVCTWCCALQSFYSPVAFLG
jgi:hypothetical protein